MGGGQTLLISAYEAIVEKRGWMSPSQWAESLALCQFTPGINLIALAALSGKRLAGARGVVAALSGLLFPSILLTVLVAAIYQLVEDLAFVKAAVHGIVMAAAGGGIVMAIRLVQSLVQAGDLRGSVLTLIASAVVVSCGVAVLWTGIPAPIIVISAASLMAVVFFARQRREVRT